MANELVNGFRHGFDTGIAPPPTISKICRNLRSTQGASTSSVSALVEAELQKGYLVGPFHFCPFPVQRVNPIGLVEGKYSKKQRLIVDMSAPHEDTQHPSLNSLIDKNQFSLSYVRVDDAVQLIKRLGPGTWMCKTDITDAFKLVPIHPSLWHLHGIKWQGLYYYYTRLVFGCRSSPKIFDTLSTAICWIAQRHYNIEYILHLLDDFICFETSFEKGDNTMTSLKQMFHDLRIPLAAHKTVGPATCLEYLGITLDSIKMEARLPTEKIVRITQIIESVLNRTRVSKRQMLVVLGHLNFAMQVIRPGRSFISYLLQLAHSVPNLQDQVTINEHCQLDFHMWREFLTHWNGVSMFILTSVEAPDITLFTDASGSLGYGGYFQGQWFSSPWPGELLVDTGSDLSIAMMELYPIVTAAVVWGTQWSRKCIRFYCDNTATVEIVNKGRSKAPAIMKLMRRLTLTAVQCNFVFCAKHVPGKNNCISDALSRLQINRFRKLAPDACLLPTPCPAPAALMFP